MRLVLDTNVWLDWLVFADPAVEPLKKAHALGQARIFVDAPCAAELERVLAYDMGKWTLDAAGRVSCVRTFRSLSVLCEEALPPQARLPSCPDPDDQKFLELAAAARAEALVTKDRELLRLARKGLGFRIVRPSEVFAGSASRGP